MWKSCPVTSRLTRETEGPSGTGLCHTTALRPPALWLMEEEIVCKRWKDLAVGLIVLPDGPYVLSLDDWISLTNS